MICLVVPDDFVWLAASLRSRFMQKDAPQPQ